MENVLLIKENGEKLNITREQALEMADNAGLDLIQLGTQENSAVCKIADYKKMMYDKEKAKKKASKTAKVDIKEVRLGWKISDNDLMIKMKNCQKMVVKDKDKVKVSVRFKGREIKLINTEGIKLMQRIKDIASEFGKCSDIKIEGNNVIMMIEPK